MFVCVYALVKKKKVFVKQTSVVALFFFFLPRVFFGRYRYNKKKHTHKYTNKRVTEIFKRRISSH